MFKHRETSILAADFARPHFAAKARLGLARMAFSAFGVTFVLALAFQAVAGAL